MIKDRYAHLEKLEASIPKVSTTTNICLEIEKQGPPSQSEIQILEKPTTINLITPDKGKAEELFASGDFKKAAEIALEEVKHWKGKID